MLLVKFDEGIPAERIAGEARRCLGFEVKTRKGAHEIPEAEERNGQMDAHGFLPALERVKEESGEELVLGVTERDLYVPELNFVFGLASPLEGVGVVSTARLEEKGEKKYLERAVKEVVHEAGHLLGLEHCHNEECVMHFSNSLAETDRKGREFCRGCKGKIQG